MKIYEFDPLRDGRWAKFVDRHPAASVFHSVGWLTALKQTYGYEPSVLTTCKTDSDLSNSLVFCRVQSWVTGRRLVSLPFSDHCQPLAEDGDTVATLISGLREVARAQGCKYIELRPVSWLTGARPSFAPSRNLCLHRLDLRYGLQEIFRRFHGDCIRRKIRRAEREVLTVLEGRTPEIVGQFYGLVVRTRKRHGLPPQPLGWFKRLVECLGPALTVRIAYKSSLPVAGILTLQHRNALTYKYGASDERFHNLGGMPYLFWLAIQDAVGRGLHEFDLGRSDLEHAGLIAFKEHLGASRSDLSYWRSPAPEVMRSTRHSWGLDLIRHTCAHIPDNCLTTLGTLVYRHIG